MYYNFHGDIAFYWIFRYDKQGKLIEKSCFSEEMYLLNRKFKPKLTGACSSLDYEFNSFGSNWLENNYKDINLNEFDIIKNINPLFDNGRKNIYEYNNNNQIINHYMKKTSYSESIFSYSYNIDNSINEILVDNQYLLKFYYDNINVLRQVITFEIINEMNTEKAIKIIEYNFSYYDEESVPPIEKN